MTFLVFGGWIFWIIIGLYVYGMIRYSDDESSFFTPFIITIILSVLVYWANKEDAKTYLTSINLYLFGAGYGVVGLMWSFFKWFRFVRKKFVAFENNFKSYNFKKGTEEYIKEYDDAKMKAMPKVSNSVHEISIWIVFWPFSVLRYVLGDLLISVTNKIVNTFANVYNRISEKQFNVK